jgi:uroporphyrinogen decarboxylase
LQGNVDPAVLFASQATIRRITQDTVATLGGVGHILNLGHGILQHTPVENAKVFIETGQQVQFANEAPAAAPSREG